MLPSPPIRAISSRMYSSRNGGNTSGLKATDINLIGLSSAAVRLEPRRPHRRQRWIIAHSPFFRTTPHANGIHNASAVCGAVSRLMQTPMYYYTSKIISFFQLCPNNQFTPYSCQNHYARSEMACNSSFSKTGPVWSAIA